MVEGGRDYGFLSLGCVFCDIEASFLVFLLELSEILLVCMSSPFFRVVLSLSSFGDESWVVGVSCCIRNTYCQSINLSTRAFQSCLFRTESVRVPLCDVI
jgi:hypothetical protein